VYYHPVDTEENVSGQLCEMYPYIYVLVWHSPAT